jgi:hypothetical protein
VPRGAEGGADERIVRVSDELRGIGLPNLADAVLEGRPRGSRLELEHLADQLERMSAALAGQPFDGGRALVEASLRRRAERLAP